MQVDLKEAVNAVSDVVQNRPRPLREFDQIHMKTGDMVMQSELVADWADGRRLAFIGDGDAISVCVAYLKARDVLDFGPSKITVFDFDERNVEAVKRFADHERLEQLDAELYNCLDPFPQPGRFDCFYTNPPWGASNEGASVKLFMQRGFEAVGYSGDGLVVIADDDELSWTKMVLGRVQAFAAEREFYVSRMQRQLHQYHLDDAPLLRSCNLFFGALPGAADRKWDAEAYSPDDPRLQNFYGKNQPPSVRYVHENKKPDYGRASEDEYWIERYK